ncbi:MAG: hypothetical protein AAGA56_24750, partial [Myxococcota bacterium]
MAWRKLMNGLGAASIALALAPASFAADDEEPLRPDFESDDPEARPPMSAQPPPGHVDYVIVAVAPAADLFLSKGGICTEEDPCIMGSGGGLVLRGGYQSPGAWYFGGAYQFSELDSDNIYLLATLQQLRAEARYFLNRGFRTRPYGNFGVGAVVYGNEF